jgi:hypothetical protein
LAVPLSAFRAGWFSLGDCPIYVDKTGLMVGLLVDSMGRDSFSEPITVHLKGVAIRPRDAQRGKTLSPLRRALGIGWKQSLPCRRWWLLDGTRRIAA